MSSAIADRLRALRKEGPDGAVSGGPLLGALQTQLFTPWFAANSYATAILSPGNSYYATLLWNLRFPHDLEPDAFDLILQSRGDHLLGATLDAAYIREGLELFVPITLQLPLTVRVVNNDDTDQQWEGSFDQLTIQTEQEYEVVLNILNDKHPDMAAILAKANPSNVSPLGQPLAGTPGAWGSQRDNLGTPLPVADQPVYGTRTNIARPGLTVEDWQRYLNPSRDGQG